MAEGQAVKLTNLKVNAEFNIDFAKTFDVADDPITEGIHFQIDTQAENSDKQRL